MKNTHHGTNGLRRLLVLMATALAITFHLHAAEYTVIDLGPGRATSINSSGQIAGAKLITFEESPASSYQTEFWQAALWSTNFTNAYVRYDLGWCPGALGWFTNRLFTNWTGRDSWPIYSFANAISDSGHITGSSTDDIYSGLDELELEAWTYGYRAFMWTPSSSNATTGTMAVAPSIETGGDSLWIIAGNGINSSNRIAGGSQFDTDFGRAFYVDYPAADLTLIDTGYMRTKFLAINNSGVSAGEAWQQGTPEDENDWFPHTAYANGTLLGTLMGTNTYQGYVGDSSATAINDSNVVVGISWYAPNSEEWPAGLYRACMWTNCSPTSIVNLGTLTNDTWSKANGISSSNKIIGSSWGEGTGMKAFIYDATNGMRDLNALIPSESGWVLQEAKGINNSGWIVGFGTKDSAEHAFLLIPNP